MTFWPQQDDAVVNSVLKRLVSKTIERCVLDDPGMLIVFTDGTRARLLDGWGVAPGIAIEHLGDEEGNRYVDDSY